MASKLPLTGDPDADRLLEGDPLALLIGMLLDQQVTMEKAFHSPYDLKERLGGRLDAGEIASMDPAKLAEVFSERPSLHRFPGSMAGRTQAMCQALVDQFGGRAERRRTTERVRARNGGTTHSISSHQSDVGKNQPPTFGPTMRFTIRA